MIMWKRVSWKNYCIEKRHWKINNFGNFILEVCTELHAITAIQTTVFKLENPLRNKKTEHTCT